MQAAARRQRGLSIVDLLIGVVIALFIAATGATLLAGNLHENRRLLLEARLIQDLRSAADLASRDLRRAGYWGAASDGVWAPGAAGVSANPYLALAPSIAASNAASYRYSRDASENNIVDGNEQFGLRLHANAIDIQLGSGNWQAMTDSGALKITAFSVTPTVQTLSLASFCARPCPAASSSCPPYQQVRSLALVISGQLPGDPSVTRSVRSEVRVRNDPVVGACGV